MSLFKDARDVVLATAYVSVMRYVWSVERSRDAGKWKQARPRVRPSSQAQAPQAQASRPSTRPQRSRPSTHPQMSRESEAMV